MQGFFYMLTKLSNIAKETLNSKELGIEFNDNVDIVHYADISEDKNEYVVLYNNEKLNCKSLKFKYDEFCGYVEITANDILDDGTSLLKNEHLNNEFRIKEAVNIMTNKILGVDFDKIQDEHKIILKMIVEQKSPRH